MLPELERSKTYKQTDNDFTSGLWHRPGRRQNTYYAGENMSGEAYPALSSRPPRRTWLRLSDGVQGMFCSNDLYLACDGELMRALSENRVEVLGNINTKPKVFAMLGNELLVLPDFKVYNTKTKLLKSRYVRLTLANVVIQNENYVDEDGIARAKKFNTLHCVDFNFRDYFSPGDGIMLAGTASNDGFYTIRSVEEFDLRFDENSFAAEDIELCTITVTGPNLEGACTCEDRIWGYRGNTIYASAPGQISNWFRYDGDEQSSYMQNVPNSTAFTGCVMHQGHPVFFTDGSMAEIFGDSPANFSIVQTCLSGVMSGSGASLCSVGGEMLYLSRNGVVRCSGSTATVISESLGLRLHDGIATTDGRRYYLSAVNEQDVRALYIYDTVTGAWHVEDGSKISYLGYLSGDVYAYCSDSVVYILGYDNTGHGTDMGAVSSYAELQPLIDDARGEIVPVRLGVRVRCAEDSELTLFVCYDDGEWEKRAQLQSEGERVWYVPLLPRPCHKLGIRIDGKGDYSILSVTKEYK